MLLLKLQSCGFGSTLKALCSLHVLQQLSTCAVLLLHTLLELQHLLLGHISLQPGGCKLLLSSCMQGHGIQPVLLRAVQPLQEPGTLLLLCLQLLLGLPKLTLQLLDSQVHTLRILELHSWRRAVQSACGSILLCDAFEGPPHMLATAARH